MGSLIRKTTSCLGVFWTILIFGFGSLRSLTKDVPAVENQAA
jgi:hypothetical protein